MKLESEHELNENMCEITYKIEYGDDLNVYRNKRIDL